MSDDPGLAQRPPRWLSHSAWADYEVCPRRYWYAYPAQASPDRPAWRGWRFGRAVHAGLEAAFRHAQHTGRWVGDDHTVETARGALRQAFGDEALNDGQLDEADDMLTASLATSPVRGDQVLDVEAWLKGRTPAGVRVAGRADLVLGHSEGSVEICDHKISRWPRTVAALGGDRQLLLYAWMARQRWPRASPMLVSHHYPPIAETVTASVDPAQVEAVTTELDRVAARIAADDRFDPQPGRHCRTCQWIERCPAGDKGPASM